MILKPRSRSFSLISARFIGVYHVSLFYTYRTSESTVICQVIPKQLKLLIRRGLSSLRMATVMIDDPLGLGQRPASVSSKRLRCWLMLATSLNGRRLLLNPLKQTEAEPAIFSAMQ